MGITDPNRQILVQIADDLGSLRDEVVFVGGATVGLLVVDPAAPSVRPTKDIDVIVQVSTRAEYDFRIREALIGRGFTELIGEDVPACAWQKGGVRLDVMPTDEGLLGFPNRWYGAAIKDAEWVDLGRLSIQVVSAPYFLATKLEAFEGRGNGDYLGSHDLEDIVAVLDGRPGIVDEMKRADPAVRDFVEKKFQTLLRDIRFRDAVPGHVGDPGRDATVLKRIEDIARFRQE